MKHKAKPSTAVSPSKPSPKVRLFACIVCSCLLQHTTRQILGCSDACNHNLPQCSNYSLPQCSPASTILADQAAANKTPPVPKPASLKKKAAAAAAPAETPRGSDSDSDSDRNSPPPLGQVIGCIPYALLLKHLTMCRHRPCHAHQTAAAQVFQATSLQKTTAAAGPPGHSDSDRGSPDPSEQVHA